MQRNKLSEQSTILKRLHRQGMLSIPHTPTIRGKKKMDSEFVDEILAGLMWLAS